MTDSSMNSTDHFGEERTLFAYYTGINTSLIAHIVISSDNILESCSKSRAASVAVTNINEYLSLYGVPNKSLLTNDEFVLAGLTIIVTLFSYYILMGKGHRKKRRRLAADLKIAQEKVHFLEERLMLLQEDEKETGEIRIFMDGAFDMMHYGHMNAFRLARSLGTHLVVGVNSDESITTCKGAPLMSDEERLTMVQGCKFVDEVVPECPYVMNSEYLNYIFKEYNIDYVIHGDDPCIVDGKDVYEAAKKAGKYQSIPRTEGVSTTDIVGRMLLMNKDHHCNSSSVVSEEAHDRNSLLCEQSKFLTTSRMLRLFSTGMKSPKNGMKIIYIDGAWDMFHCGHVKILAAAKKRGDFLIVGIHGDALVNRERGCNLPLMNLHERVLSVLGCRFVDDVLIDAPGQISPQMIKSLNIDEVVHGTNEEDFGGQDNKNDRYKYAKAANIFVELESPSKFSLLSIIDRIRANQAKFQAKIAKKKKAEDDFYNQKYSGTDN